MARLRYQLISKSERQSASGLFHFHKSEPTNYRKNQQRYESFFAKTHYLQAPL